MFGTLSYAFYFISDKISAGWFKDESISSLKTNDRLKFDQYTALNHVIEKGKPQLNLSYKVLKEKYGYDPLLGISPYPTLVQLKYYIDGIHHFVTVVGKWIFDSSFLFALPLTQDKMY